MTKPGVWECEWCGETKQLSTFQYLFRWFMPRFCPVSGYIGGWEHPSCRISYALASRIAERATKIVYDELMKESKGLPLGKLRAHPLVHDISHSEKSIYSGKSHPTRIGYKST